ncbi:lytic transglycosylase domain-containing protein [Sphingomonas sp. ASV193]|uniref:lytic transglycosylase domain-containing protein n=1 Tax=Sphingomonas sp. ASV193 TaxID=3144405 RepID=UPI0032E8798C
MTLLLAGLMIAAPAAADPVDQWAAEIERASARFAIPQGWIRAVMRAESGGHPWRRGRPVVSRAGAMGLMQIMPGTWDEVRRQHGLGADPFDPADNIYAGTAYLRAMYDRFGYPGMLAAYNAGPGRYTASRREGRPLPAETRAYVRTVSGKTAMSEAPPPAGYAPQASLFAVQKEQEKAANETDQPTSEANFFVISAKRRTVANP